MDNVAFSFYISGLYIEHSMKSNVVRFNKPNSLKHTSATSRFEIVFKNTPGIFLEYNKLFMKKYISAIIRHQYVLICKCV